MLLVLTTYFCITKVTKVKPEFYAHRVNLAACLIRSESGLGLVGRI